MGGKYGPNVLHFEEAVGKKPSSDFTLKFLFGFFSHGGLCQLHGVRDSCARDQQLQHDAWETEGKMTCFLLENSAVKNYRDHDCVCVPLLAWERTSDVETRMTCISHNPLWTPPGTQNLKRAPIDMNSLRSTKLRQSEKCQTRAISADKTCFKNYRKYHCFQCCSRLPQINSTNLF